MCVCVCVYIYIVKCLIQFTSPHTVTIYFPCVIINFKIYSLNNIQIYNTVSLARVTMLYITSQGLNYLIIGSLYLLTPFTHFAYLP